MPVNPNQAKYHLERIRRALTMPARPTLAESVSAKQDILRALEFVLEEMLPELPEVDEEPKKWLVICQVCNRTTHVPVGAKKGRCTACGGPVWYYESRPPYTDDDVCGPATLGGDGCE
jgi:rRNA maturation endonuclease Nob1